MVPRNSCATRGKYPLPVGFHCCHQKNGGRGRFTQKRRAAASAVRVRSSVACLCRPICATTFVRKTSRVYSLRFVFPIRMRIENRASFVRGIFPSQSKHALQNAVICGSKSMTPTKIRNQRGRSQDIKYPKKSGFVGEAPCPQLPMFLHLLFHEPVKTNLDLIFC